MLSIATTRLSGDHYLDCAVCVHEDSEFLQGLVHVSFITKGRHS